MNTVGESKPGNGNSRRRFIQGLGGAAVASTFAGNANPQARKSGAAGGTSYGPPPGSLEEGGGWNANALPQPGPLSKEPMPMVQFGKHKISRLIFGHNAPGSHFSWKEVASSQKWLTPERILLQNKRMEELGINCMEGGQRMALYKEQGGNILWSTSGSAKSEILRNTANWKAPQANGAISIIHDSVATDTLFRAGKIDLIREYVKMAKDAGMFVGVSSHIPEVFETIESQGGWDLDYFMCAVYRFGRTHDEWIKEFPTNSHMLPVEIGHPYEQYMPAAIYGGEVAFVKGDPPKMFKVVQQTKKPCFIFKVMACGRLCQSPATAELTLKYVLENIKSSDILVIGMGDQYLDEFAFNKECVVKYSKLSRPVA